VARDELTAFDAAGLSTRTYVLPGVTGAALASDGRLYATTARAIYASSPAGDLALVYDAGANAVHGLVACGDRVWFVDGTELGAVEGNRVAETSGAGIAAGAALAPSPSGDVWVIEGGGLRRFARKDPASRSNSATALRATWRGDLAPLFARDCAACHLPSGLSGIDLSSPGAWEAERAAIRERVVVRRSMPPEGHAMPDADREAVRAWAEGKP
jgi:mono/diheme cytochrome c family protein